MLFQAHRSKAALAPVVGALVGGAVLGPVGLLLGAKGGVALTAVGGMVAGGLAGRLIKNKVDQDTQLALANAAAAPSPHDPLLTGSRLKK